MYVVGSRINTMARFNIILKDGLQRCFDHYKTHWNIYVE